MFKTSSQESVRVPQNGVKVDKIKRYGWTVIDKPGEFIEIDKTELRIDPSYQRTKWNQSKITSYAAEWSWVNCGTLTVAIRDNEWWVIDGATRKQAADRRSDIKKLPCMVYELDGSVPKEAIRFVKINDGKTKVGSYDRFKALLVSGDECATELNKLFASTGHKASPSSGIKNVSCLLTVWNLYKKNKFIINALWPLITDINQDCQIRDTVVRGLFWVEVQARKSGTTLLKSPYRAFLISQGGECINSEIKRECMIIGKGGARIEANAIIKFINKGKRGMNKIPII